MKTVGVATSGHDTAGEGVNDEDLVILDNVVCIALHDTVSAHSLIDMVGDGSILGI